MQATLATAAESKREACMKQSDSIKKKQAVVLKEMSTRQQKIDNVRRENSNLESQLEKAQSQVDALMSQIGQFDAKAAREWKAEKRAKQIAREARTRYPTGDVALAFSDVECSTAQWDKFPAFMSAAMEIHNSILRDNLTLTGGYEVKTEGDSFMVAFHSPISAVWWCLFVQEALVAANWPGKQPSSTTPLTHTDAHTQLHTHGSLWLFLSFSF